MSRTFVYEYELRRAEEIVATGRFSSDRPLAEGDSVVVARGRPARVDRVLPASGLDGRLVLRGAE